MSDRLASAETSPPSEPERAPSSSRHGVEDKLALALVLPLAAGALVASFLPWPAWRWVGLAAAGLLTALVVWLWLRHSLVLPLRILVDALESGRGPEPRAIRSVSAWGELAGLSEAVHAAMLRQRRLERDLEELAALRFCVGRLATGVEAWVERDERPAFAGDDGLPDAARPLVHHLRRALETLDGRAHEARTVADLVRESIDDARTRGEAVTGGAERQFVEATSLLTVLLELRRWAGELAPAIDALRTAAAARVGEDGAGGARWTHLLDEALEGGLLPLTVAEQAALRLSVSAEDVTFLLESARLARIEAAVAALSGSPEAATFVDALETFGRDTAALRERMLSHERATREELAAARQEIAGLEAAVHAAARELATVTQHPGLAGAPLVPRGVDPALGAKRSLDRVHEMVAEALARGEKLVQQAERTSSEALRAGDGVRVALDELDGFRTRLAPPAPPPEDIEVALDAAGGLRDDGGFAPAPDPAAPPMRVLGPADLLEDEDDAGFRG
ncbi:MAG: hypothetical protein ABIP29_03330 [Candidatus Eisenbacteria bacterium]